MTNNNNYPTNLTEAYYMLINWKGTKAPYQTLTTSGNDKEVIAFVGQSNKDNNHDWDKDDQHAMALGMLNRSYIERQNIIIAAKKVT